MQVGINYPWVHCDWDFGEPPVADGHQWGPRAAWRSRIERDLEQFRQLGIFAVRWWVLGNGLLYGTGDDVPRLSESGWEVRDVPRLAEEVIEDFSSAFPFFQRANIKMMPVFADYRMFLDPTAPREGAPTLNCVGGGRQQLISDAAKRAQFLRNALRPLLAASSPFREVIYAWDLCNEPEWCVVNPGHGVPRGSRPTVYLSGMKGFLREGVALINNAGFRSSVGFANRITVDAWHSIELGVRLNQFHYYPRGEALAANTFSARYPLILGEFASAAHRPWPDLAGQEERVPTSIVYWRLLHAAINGGYPAAFIWSAEENPSDSGEIQSVEWNEQTRDQIRRFTGYTAR